jgi:hypothetical protein
VLAEREKFRTAAIQGEDIVVGRVDDVGVAYAGVGLQDEDGSCRTEVGCILRGNCWQDDEMFVSEPRPRAVSTWLIFTSGYCLV